MVYCIITDSVEAFFDLWIIVDQFLDSMTNVLQIMINEAKENRQLPRLYIQEFYNIHHFTDMKDIKNPAAGRIYNSFVDVLNKRPRLPRFIIIIIDETFIIEDINVFEDDSITSLREEIHWLTKKVHLAIRRKRLNILEKKPGAIYGADPTVIYVRMIHRIDVNLRRGSKKDEEMALRAKCNDALNDCVARLDQNILTINSCNTGSHFTNLGELSSKGKDAFWLELDNLLERFDRKDVKLLPHPVSNRKCKLPTPP